eukprot:TRINITY_DN8503_c0_g1_i6.p1 TRINITY_DN8503_c0_g1~~TRINITY_DN8503_c0_g1_i6.p1  ORF type:complete len:200 (+),score=12.37 TRINITY_DN8503_c0_g1_i6:221-820(+)
MNIEKVCLSHTYMYTPTVVHSPSKLKVSAFSFMPNLSLDLQGDARHEQILTAQILFPDRESKEQLNRSLVMSGVLEKELNSLKALILSQSTCITGKHFPCLPRKSSPSRECPALAFAPFGATEENGLEHRVPVDPEKDKDAQEDRLELYTKVERQRKIRKYKDKLQRRRKLHPLSRRFEGRRRVAFAKARNNGRFAKAI